MVLDKYCPVGPLDWEDLIEFLGAGNSTRFGGRNRYHCSYVIYTDGTYYYAENGNTGKLDYGGPSNEGGINGANAAAVINAVFTSLVNGGKVVFRRGDYPLTERLILFNRNEVQLTGEQGARLYATAGMNDNILVIDTVSRCIIENLEFDGQKALQAYGGDTAKQHGIYVSHGTYIWIRNNYIHDAVNAGIYLLGPDNENIFIMENLVIENGMATSFRGGIFSYYSNNVYIDHNYFKDNYRINVALIGQVILHATGFFVTNNLMDGTIDSGNDANLLAWLCDNGIISGNKVINAQTSDGTATGIRVEVGENWVIESNLVENNLIGVRVYDVGTTQVNILNNQVVNNRDRGIMIQDLTYSLIQGNLIKDNLGNGIELANNPDYITITDNVLDNNLAPIIIGSGTNLLIHDNQGYNAVGPIATPYPVAAGLLTDVAAVQAFPTSNTNYTVDQSPKFVTIYGGVVTSISIDGTATGLTGGSFYLSPGQVLNVVWTGQPSSVVYAV